MKIILGSSSPRRRDILNLFFPEFDIIVPEVEEIFYPEEKPLEFACRITEKKMEDIKSRVNFNFPYLAITSDTIVTIDDEILGKPADHDNALKMLKSLSGRTHKVITSLSLHLKKSDKETIETTDHEITEVLFKKLSNEAIEKYLQSINYMDKAGSYAIQEHGDMIIEKYQGSLSNVIGFPVRLFLKMLHENRLIEII